MWKLSRKPIVAGMAACGAALALSIGCSDGDGVSVGGAGEAGVGAGGGSSVGGAGKGGSAAGGGAGASSGGAPSAGNGAGGDHDNAGAGGDHSPQAGSGGGLAGGAGTAGQSGAGASGGGSGAAGAAGKAGAGGSSGGSGAAGAGAGGAAGHSGAAGAGGAAGHSGAAGAGGAAGHSGAAAGGAAGSSGAAGTGGTSGSAGTAGTGGSPFQPVPITVVNGTFESGPDNQPAQSWQSTGDTAASYVHYDGSSAHAGYGYLAFYGAAAYSVDTHQTFTGLNNGTYELTAWIKGGTAVSLYANNYTSNVATETKTDITPTSTYAQYLVTGIQVTSGKITIGVRATAAAGGWANTDDVTLTRVQ